MKKIIMFALGIALAMPSMAQQKVVDRFGRLVDMPAYGSPEASNIVPRRCGTFIMQQQEEALAKKNGPHKVIANSNPAYVPHKGKITIPVILVNFKDVKFTVKNPRQAFEQFFNGTSQAEMGNYNSYNFGSVAKYFSDMSGGVFTPTFKLFGPVTLDQDETYYGGKSASGSDENERQLVKDAIAKVQASSERISDATEFCANGQTIDCVYIMYAGAGQNYGGPATAVWAKTGNISTTFANKSTRWFSMAGELMPSTVPSTREIGGVTVKKGDPIITGVGVTCHELSHALGLPDFYPTSSSAYLDNQEMEYWDLMDGGEYAGSGFSPTAYTAWEKNEMEWPVTIETLNENKAVTMEQSTEAGGTAYKIVNPKNSHEYFMLECMQQRRWNRFQYGNGLMVYHVYEPADYINNGLHAYTRFNNNPHFPGMAIVPADGNCYSSFYNQNNADFQTVYTSQLQGDLFPGTGNMNPDTLNVSELSDSLPQPNFCWYNSTSNPTAKLETNKALRNIKYDATTGAVSFNYVHDWALGINSITADNTTADKRIFTIDGRYVGTNRALLPKGLYITAGHKFIVK